MSLQLALPGEPPPPDYEGKSQYDTPRWIAERMVKFAGIGPGMHVLEPSAGRGALAIRAREAGAAVTCAEIDPSRIDYLEACGFHMWPCDFLTTVYDATRDMFDLALANPPFDDGNDLEHTLHMLHFAPRVVALLPLGTLDGVERYERLWSKHTLAGLAVLVRRFKAEGSEHSGQRPFGVFDIRRGVVDVPMRREWWAR